MLDYAVIDNSGAKIAVFFTFEAAKKYADERSDENEWLTVYQYSKHACIYDGASDGNGTYLR